MALFVNKSGVRDHLDLSPWINNRASSLVAISVVGCCLLEADSMQEPMVLSNQWSASVALALFSFSF